MPGSLGDAAQVRLIVEQSLSAMREIDGASRDFVTREELGRDMAKVYSDFARELTNLEGRIDVKLENAILKTRNWVLGGIVASAVVFGGGFYSMMSKFDRTADAVIAMQQSLDSRREWINENDERDRQQDEVLKQIKPTYTPLPFEVNPK